MVSEVFKAKCDHSAIIGIVCNPQGGGLTRAGHLHAFASCVRVAQWITIAREESVIRLHQGFSTKFINALVNALVFLCHFMEFSSLLLSYRECRKNAVRGRPT